MEREERLRQRTVVCLCSPFADKSSCSLNGWVCECVLRRSAAYNTNRTAHYASESLNIAHSVCMWQRVHNVSVTHDARCNGNSSCNS